MAKEMRPKVTGHMGGDRCVLKFRSILEIGWRGKNPGALSYGMSIISQ